MLMYSEGSSASNTLTSNISSSDGGEQSSWSRVRQQVMDMLQTALQLPTTAPITDQVLHFDHIAVAMMEFVSRVPKPPGKSWNFFVKFPGRGKSRKMILFLESPANLR